MALSPCRVCKKDVADDAKTCPHCGAGEPSKSVKAVARRWLEVLFIIGAIVLVFGVVRAWREDEAASGSGPKPGDTMTLDDKETSISDSPYAAEYTVQKGKLEVDFSAAVKSGGKVSLMILRKNVGAEGYQEVKSATAQANPSIQATLGPGDYRFLVQNGNPAQNQRFHVVLKAKPLD